MKLFSICSLLIYLSGNIEFLTEESIYGEKEGFDVLFNSFLTEFILKLTIALQSTLFILEGENSARFLPERSAIASLKQHQNTAPCYQSQQHC